MALAHKHKILPTVLEHADLVPMGDIIPYPGNPRQGSLPDIIQSLEENGQYRPIIANRRNRYILAGNNVYQGATALAWTHIAVTWVDVDHIAELKILAIDNKAGDKASYDTEALAKVITELAQANALVGTGYTADEAQDLMDTLAAVPPVPYQAFTGDYAPWEQTPPLGFDPDAAPEDAAHSQVGQLREVIVMVKDEDHAPFLQRVKALMKHYDTTSLTDTVQEAIRREAATVLEEAV